LPLTPYITPALLTNAPTGVSWKIIPAPKSSDRQQYEEQLAICWRATSIVETFCNQPLRSTVNTEELSGPGNIRVGIQPGSGNGLLVMRRWPVTQVLAVQTSPNRLFPRQWSLVPSSQYEIEHPLINVATGTAAADGPDGGSSILLSPGIIDPRRGRNYLRLLTSYTNGWPHTSLTATATAGATVINVDDVTGWAGASGFAYDGGSTEPVAVQSVSATAPLPLPNGVGVAQTGPGTVTLTAPLAFQHTQGVVVSALPANVLWATVLAAATQALESGITAITIQNLPGSETTGGHGVEDLQMEYELLLQPFRRIV
jgi:hypothetical protein